MDNKTHSEWILWIIVALPFLYLAYLWPSLPEQVPLHWNLEGEIDRYGSKKELIIIPFLLPFLTYLIFLVVPYIDPKKKIELMGKKYHQLKFVLVLFMSCLALYILYSTKTEKLFSSRVLFVLIGLLFSAIGNYMPSMKPNYFIGIRTPWTLEHEDIWYSTHRLAGVLWAGGGLLIIVLAITLPSSIFIIPFFIVIAIMVIIPLVYSYLLYRNIE